MKRKPRTLEEWKRSVDPLCLAVAQRGLDEFGLSNESVLLRFDTEELQRVKDRFEAAGYVLTSANKE